MLSRRRGAIVNIGSAAGVSSCPLLAEYGAAKSYIATFSKGQFAVFDVLCVIFYLLCVICSI